MSVTFCWRIVSKKDKHFSGGLSNDHSALERAFGGPPWKLDQINIPALQGMAAVADHSDHCIYDNIIRAIEAHGLIEIWPEY